VASPSVGAPRIDRPAIPAAYGVTSATEFVEWSHVEERLEKDREYWLATVGQRGHPSVRPVDGLYVDGVIYVGGSPETRWVRDVAVNPRVSVHLDGLDDVVMIEGEAEIMRHMADALAERLGAASVAKFPEYRMTAEVYRERGAIAIRPRTVVAWNDITKNPTRFRFEP